MNATQRWSILFLLTGLALVISYVWLDRPIALLAHDQLARYDIFAKLTRIPEIIAPLLILAFAAIGLRVLSGRALKAMGLRALNGRALPKLQTVVVLATLSLAVADAITDQLKFAFGRVWPETWMGNNPSFIRDHAYGFNPFHGGPGFAAFPSKHTAAICAVMSVLWICYPRFRPLYALAIAAVAAGLVGANYHFLGDVIAGGFVGISTGWLTIRLWELGQRKVSGDAPPEPKSKIGISRPDFRLLLHDER
jgi:membrane-associated phospholipid phosphatase